MLPIKRILCPLDFSDHSLNALAPAVELAQQFGAELYLPHVITPVPIVPTPPHPIAFDIPEYQRTLEENSGETLSALIDEKVPADVTVVTAVIHGDPAHEIIKYASDNEIDLMVISTHGHSGIEHLIFGSVAEKIIRHAPCPVLTIRAK